MLDSTSVSTCCCNCSSVIFIWNRSRNERSIEAVLEKHEAIEGLVINISTRVRRRSECLRAATKPCRINILKYSNISLPWPPITCQANMTYNLMWLESTYINKLLSQLKWRAFKSQIFWRIWKNKTKIYVNQMSFMVQKNVPVMSIYENVLTKNHSIKIIKYLSLTWIK